MPIESVAKSAFDEVEAYYQERSQRARELREQGKSVVGYLCSFIPVELLTAAEVVPYRIQGSVTEPITEADAFLETIMCPFVRSCFDLALKDKYNFLDGVVMPHSCDTIQKIFDIWIHYCPSRYHHYIDVPHMIGASSLEFFKKELQRLARSLENFSGRKLTRERLHHAITVHNENRALLRELYELRKSEPPLISGTEVIKLIVASMGMPVEESNALVMRVIDEVKSGKHKVADKLPRVLVFGSEIDDIAFIKLVEEAGSNVVMDDLCTTSRRFQQDIEVTDDPYDGIATYYLQKINCPRTYKPQGETRQKDLDNRFGHLIDFVTDFHVDGIIQYIIRFCDTYELEVPDLREYMRGHNVPLLCLEDDYSTTSIGQLRTRVQAFLEML